MDSRPNLEAIGGGRRIISILFCDVRGSTSVAEDLDPEEWAEIMNGAFERIMRPVYRYEGTVVRLLGDAMLAFFGAPIAREDDPLRAVLAGLEIQEVVKTYGATVRANWGVNFSVRVGVNTGLVVVGAFGGSQHSEYTAMGDAVNLAARMEQTAQPGTVQISESTYRLVAPLVDVEDLGEIAVKGKDDPVRAFRVLRRRAKPGSLRGIPGVETPFVGRGIEFAILVSALGRLQRDEGGVIFIVGEAGLGKSRLLREVEQYTARAFPRTRWYKTGSFSYERAQPYGQVQRLLRSVCGILGDDAPELQRQKIADTLNRLTLAAREETQQSLEVLFGLVGDANAAPKLEGESFKGSLYATMTPFWRALTSLHPIVVAFDDMQWADSASAALLEHVLGDVGGNATLMLCAMRPSERSAGAALLESAKTHFTNNTRRIVLRPLTSSENEQLVSSLLPSNGASESLRRAILAKSAGNPLFVEEVIRVLRDRGPSAEAMSGSLPSMTPDPGTLEVPENLQTLLTARVDHLHPDVRETLLLASVLGPVVNFRLLTCISERNEETLLEHLRELEGQGLIKAATRTPELEFRFVHVLLQETAYRMLLRRERRQFHLRVAESLEQIFADSLDEHTVLLAHHFDRAHSLARASYYYGKAGAAALRLYSVQEAISHFTRALDLVKEQAPDHITEECRRLFTDKGRAQELAAQFEDALATYTDMENVAKQYQDRELELAALVARTPLYAVPTRLFDPETAGELGERALSLARELGDEAAEARLLWSLSNVYALTNRLDTATAYGEKSLALAERLDLRDQMALTLTDLGVFCYGVGGQIDKATKALQRAADICRELNDLPMLGDDLASLALVSWLAGDYAQSEAFSAEAQRISESINNLWGQSYSRYKLGVVYWEGGEPDRSIETIETCLRLGEQAGFLASQIEPRIDLGAIYAHLGAFERAQEELDRAMAVPLWRHLPDHAYSLSMRILVRLGMGDMDGAQRLLDDHGVDHSSSTWPSYLGPLLIAEAEMALARGDEEEALALSSELLEDLHKHGIRAHLPRALLLRGRVLACMGKMDDARGCLRQARLEADVIGSRWMQWQILAALADLEEESQESTALHKEARTILDGIMQNLTDESLRQSFQSLPAVAALWNDGEANRVQLGPAQSNAS